MTGARLQAAAALILALGLHLGAFALRPDAAGASGSSAGAGSGGQELISLQAAGASLSALVAEWDSPPDMPPLADLSAPPGTDTAPTLGTDTAAAQNPVATRVPAPLSTALPDLSPIADTAPPPLPRPATKPKPRPSPPAAPVREKPRATPAPASDSTAAQTATGSGSDAVAGSDGQAQTPTLSQGRIDDLMANWGASIRARIEKRKRYPMAADGASGTVTVRLTVTRSGALAGLDIAASSGNAALDEAAIRAVRAAGRFPAAPDGLTQNSTTFTLPMRFAR